MKSTNKVWVRVDGQPKTAIEIQDERPLRQAFIAMQLMLGEEYPRNIDLRPARNKPEDFIPAGYGIARGDNEFWNPTQPFK